MKFKVTVGVFGIIPNETDEILLIHRNDHDLWNLPGGGLEPGESPWDGVIREIKEETGLDVEVSQLLGVYSKPEKDEIVFTFKCVIIGGELALTSESRAFTYCNLDQIPENTVRNHVDRLHHYFAEPDKLTMNIQRGKSTLESIRESKL